MHQLVEHISLSIVDDFSRGVWVYSMKHKSEVERCLQSFICMVEKQFGTKIIRLRTDNGLEFTSSKMQKFYKKKGIVMELACAYTPNKMGWWRGSTGIFSRWQGH